MNADADADADADYDNNDSDERMKVWMIGNAKQKMQDEIHNIWKKTIYKFNTIKILKLTVCWCVDNVDSKCK